MKRWFWKRWVWAVLVGTTATVGMTLAQIGKDTTSWPPKVGDTITLPFEQGPKQVKILKAEKQPDGSYLCEVRDSKSGETFNLLERQPSGNPQTPAASQPPRNNPRAADPMLPSIPGKDMMPGGEKDKEKGRVTQPSTSSKDKTTTSQKPEEERPGLLKRLFGRKKQAEPDANAMPAATSAKPAAPSMPPAIRATPPVAGSSSEPPRTLPIRPVSPPTPSIPAPVAIPSAPPVTPPPATPTQPLPIPSIPAAPPSGAPGAGGLPPIPVPPNGVSATKPMQPVVPAGREVPAPTQPAVHPDLKAHAQALRNALAPSQRALAVRAMCCSQHGCTDSVKAMVFDAAQHDPCPMVRAVCIEELCKMGYNEKAFMTFVEKACSDKSDEVKAAAKAAMMKMMQQR